FRSPSASPSSPVWREEAEARERLSSSPDRGRERANLDRPLADRFRAATTSLSIHTLHFWHHSILACSTSPLSGLSSLSSPAGQTDEDPSASDFVSGHQVAPSRA